MPNFLTNTSNALSIYLHKRVLALLLLGFSAGLPYVLVFSTLTFWLREAGVERATIGYFSWIAIIYAFKWAWSPLVDRMPIPFLSRLMGRRRAWMIVSQLMLIFAIMGMAFSDPINNLSHLVFFALVVAFSSATQDIVIDAFRIESAEEKMQAALAAAYQTGYRIAMIVASAGALKIAFFMSPDPNVYNLQAWQWAYFIIAMLIGVGLITTLFAKEPKVDLTKSSLKELQLKKKLSQKYPEKIAGILAWLHTSAVLPFLDFFNRYGKHAIVILAFISCYRISDIVMGVMANVFYTDMNFSKDEIANISKIYGLIMTLVGAGCGGLLIAKYNTIKILFLGALLVALTNLLFALQASIGYNVNFLTFVISVDNFSAGVATAAFIAYLSGLTSTGYSATQYALLSSIMLLFPKFIAGFSGVFVDKFGYEVFFIFAGLIGLPVLILVSMIAKIPPIKENEDKS